jgi:hypothetical protein
MANEPRELVEYKTDHDLLIELRTEFKGMRDDIRDIKDTAKAAAENFATKDVTDDHEDRIRWLENRGWMLTGAVLLASTVISYAIAIYFH